MDADSSGDLSSPDFANFASQRTEHGGNEGFGRTNEQSPGGWYYIGEHCGSRKSRPLHRLYEVCRGAATEEKKLGMRFLISEGKLNLAANMIMDETAEHSSMNVVPKVGSPETGPDPNPELDPGPSQCQRAVRFWVDLDERGEKPPEARFPRR